MEAIADQFSDASKVGAVVMAVIAGMTACQ